MANNAAIINPDGLLPSPNERVIYREPYTGAQREIWMPGDPDGDPGTDYYERVGPALPLEKKWRLFQTDIGKLSQRNMPPRFVFLDDKAAADVLNSDIQRAKLTQYWPHDFGGPGKVRSRRPHRGRGAVDMNKFNAPGDEIYETTITGGKKETYVFTGERSFQPVVYRYEPPAPPVKKAKKRKPEPGDIDYNPRGHGHNQYTPKDLMVKHGAPTFSLKARKADAYQKPPRINSFLRRDASPLRTAGGAMYGSMVGTARRAKEPGTLRQSEEDQDAPEDWCAMEDLTAGVMNPRLGGAALCAPQSEYLRPQSRSYGHQSAASINEPDDSDEEEIPVIRRPPQPAEQQQEVNTAFDPKDVPPDMGYIERHAYRQKLASQTIASIHDQEDVARIANELSEANVKIGQKMRENERQAKDIQCQVEEIAQLRAELERSQDSALWQAQAESANSRVQELQEKVQMQEGEIEQLTGECFDAQTRVAALENEIGRMRRGHH